MDSPSMPVKGGFNHFQGIVKRQNSFRNWFTFFCSRQV